MIQNRRTLRLTAAAAALVAGAGFAAAAAAHPEGEAGRKDVIIVTDAEHSAGKEGEVRRFHIERHGDGMEKHTIHIRRGDGAPDRIVHLDSKLLADCEGGEKIVDESAGDDGKKTKFVFCAKGDSQDRVQRLEQALERIQSNEHISGEHKERIASSLRDAIDRARSAR